MLKSIVFLEKNELEHSRIGYTYRKNVLAFQVQLWIPGYLEPSTCIVL